MRPASLALLLLVLAGGAVGYLAWRDATEPDRAWNQLLELEGRDLSNDPRAAAIVERFASLRSTGEILYRPWLILRIHVGRPEERILVFLLRSSAGSKHVSVHLDVREPNGPLVWNGGFNTRAGDRPAAIRVDGGRLVVEFDSPVRRQVYALLGDAFRLLRMEDANGSRMQNGYAYGKSDDPHTWERELSGGDSDVALACLTFLGEHPPPGFRYTEEYRRVRDLIRGLRKSPDAWIREAAEAVPLDASR